MHTDSVIFLAKLSMVYQFLERVLVHNPKFATIAFRTTKIRFVRKPFEEWVLSFCGVSSLTVANALKNLNCLPARLLFCASHHKVACALRAMTQPDS